MATGRTITLVGADKVMKGIKDFSIQKQKRVEEIIEDGARRIEAMAIRAAPVNDGQLRRSISKNKVKEGFEIVAQTDYAVYVETGTKKNFDVDPEFAAYVAQFKGQTGEKGLDEAILEWVKAKGIKFERAPRETKKQTRTVRSRYLTDEQTAFIIARFIAFHGIKPHPYLLPSFVKVRKEMIEEIIKELRA